MTMKSFWMKWRAEILRGSVIFVVVVGAGLALVSAFRTGVDRIKTSTRGFIPQLAQGLNVSLGGGFDDPGRTHGDAWSWHKKLASGQQITIRNTNGPVEVHAAEGSETLVETEKSWLGSDSAAVQVVANETSDGVTLCAVMAGSRNGECGGERRWTSNDHHGIPKVAVKFTVHVPSGVRVDVEAGVGDVIVDGGTAGLKVHSATGDISVTSMAWPVDLVSNTGDVSATLGAPGREDATVKSGTGDVSVSLPAQVNLSINAHTGTGDLSDQFDLPVSEAQYGPSKSLTGNLGSGGAVLTLTTGTGDISLNKVDRSQVRVTSVRVGKGAHGVTVVAPVAPTPPAPAKP
ncbi:MAG TPA: DUF4097 family beta strand repeat-containing protein [Gemmatimonadales bacterium]|nr:DUF4097 family beta strand repeat-containing protein [Gemmatimonadales bacterium]